RWIRAQRARAIDDGGGHVQRGNPPAGDISPWNRNPGEERLFMCRSIGRIRCSASTGIGVQDGPEYAPTGDGVRELRDGVDVVEQVAAGDGAAGRDRLTG